MPSSSAISSAALDKTKDRVRGYFTQDPVDTFRNHVWINPFWEDDISEVIGHMGADRVILGSDWPHMEGLAEPRDLLDELDGIADSRPLEDPVRQHRVRSTSASPA